MNTTSLLADRISRRHNEIIFYDFIDPESYLELIFNPGLNIQAIEIDLVFDFRRVKLSDEFLKKLFLDTPIYKDIICILNHEQYLEFARFFLININEFNNNFYIRRIPSQTLEPLFSILDEAIQKYFGDSSDINKDFLKRTIENVETKNRRMQLNRPLLHTFGITTNRLLPPGPTSSI